MLRRVLEPEVMDTAEEAREYDAMDHSAVNDAFIADFLGAGPLRGPLLDLGTGTALIPIELCRREPRASVVAVDLADSMLALARRNIDAARLVSRIELKKADGKRLPFGDGSFFAVISNSIVHHIPEPLRAFAEAVRVTRRGGRLFFRDLLRPKSNTEVRRLVDLHAGDATPRQRALFEASLRAALTLEEVRGLIDELGLRGGDVAQTSDRHWTLATPVP